MLYEPVPYHLHSPWGVELLDEKRPVDLPALVGMKGSHLQMRSPTVSSKNLGVKPVEEDQSIGSEENPGEKRDRFTEALEEWGTGFLSPVTKGRHA